MIKYTWILSFIAAVTFGYLYFKSITVPTQSMELSKFILIEYKDNTFHLTSDILSKAECMQELLDIECLSDSLIISNNIESVTIITQ